MKKIILASSLLAILTVSCSKSEPEAIQRVVEVDMNPESYLNVENSRRQYNAHSGDFYYGVDSIAVYGAGYSKHIPDTLRGYDMDICVSAWVREVLAPAEGGMGISLNKKNGETKDWKGLRVKPENFKPNEWAFVTDTFRYKADFISDIDEIKIFSMKQTGRDNFDVDDLKIKYIFHK